MFMFRHPKGKANTDKNLFLIPFEDPVWISLMTILFFGMVMLVLIHKFELSSLEPTIISTSFMNTISFLALQDITTPYTSFHSKIILIIVFFLTFLIWQFYGAAIVSSLLIPLPKYIKDVQGLLESDLKIILEDVASSVGSFKVTNNEYGRRLYQQKVQGQEKIYSVPEGVKFVRDGGYAFYTYVDWAYDYVRKTFTADEIDDLVEISFYPKAVHSNMYYPIEKYSPYKEMFRVGAQSLVETGVAARMTIRWVSDKPVGNLDNNEVAVVDFNHTATLIYLLLFGYFISLIVLTLEKIVSFKTNLRK